MTMELVEESRREEEQIESKPMIRGVRHLCESGITRVPPKYILPVSDRPKVSSNGGRNVDPSLQLPVIDLSQLRSSTGRFQLLQSLANACKDYGFFQVVNHGIDRDVIERMIGVGKRFFELPFEERVKYMSTDVRAPVRYGTSFNETQDGVFCWRDFLKLNCQPLASVLPHWPSAPLDLRAVVTSYANQTRSLFVALMEAILATLGVSDTAALRRFDRSSHLLVVNCYPACPEPNLTLGMPPHSDYGFLTLLLQDEVPGLQVQCRGEWVTVDPAPDALVVNIGDHLEIFSNGRYKSVLHRVVVNSVRSRISVASLHSLPFDSVVSPLLELVSDDTPRLYHDTDFAAFLDYLASGESKPKGFLHSRKLTMEDKKP